VRRYRYNCGGPELTGGIVDLLLPLVIGLVFGFMFGVAVGYSVRARISRRRRAAANEGGIGNSMAIRTRQRPD